MSGEAETNQTRCDSTVASHRPASDTSQDISHVLASLFKELCSKDVIGRDTFSALVQTKPGQNSFHDRYVEKLQQAHSEYEKSMKEADMLEGHIIQGRVRAAAKEKHARERLMEDVGDHQGLLTVKSTFHWCVDQDLLEKNGLISPKDYLATQKPHYLLPAPIKPDPARPTFAYNMHISREPQDDSYTVIPKPRKISCDMDKLDCSLTFESSSDSREMKKTPKEKSSLTKVKPKWKGRPSTVDQAEGWDELQKLKDPQRYLRNPRFLPPNTQRGGMSLVQPRTKMKVQDEKKGNDRKSSTDDPVPVFQANPPVVTFTEYNIGHVYELTLELKNMTSSSRHVRIIPPNTLYFSIGLGRFPGEGGVIAPGMSCKYTLRFAPDSLGDFNDFIVVETQGEDLFVVPIEANRPPPILTIPRVMDCGSCLIGGVKFVEFHCQNVGLSTGTFCIIPKSQWPVSNLRPVVRTFFTELPPFAVSPSLFVLQPNDAIIVEVVFFPSAAEKCCQVFTVVCDNCQVQDISLEGEGQLVALELVSVSGENEPPVAGELRDLTADHFVRFSPCNPHCEQQKKLVIRNNVPLELPFFWQIMQPNLPPLLPWETPLASHVQFHPTTDDVLHVSPLAGALAPCQDQEFLFTFCPKELKDYHGVCHLVLMDVPQVLPEPTENRRYSPLQPVQSGSKLNNVIVLEIEVKGLTEPYQILLEPPAIIIPGEISVCTATRRRFKMWNNSRNTVMFQWEKLISSSYLMEVEPSTGSIGTNECCDLILLMTGEKPEKVVTRLICHIQHRPEPITLPVGVSFKGPVITVSEPSVDFGLMRLGKQARTTLHLRNPTGLNASWTLGERVDGLESDRDSQILVEPCRGVLPCLASCSVQVTFRPHFCQQLETELELNVENGTGCHFSLRAEVQTPQVCLLSCNLFISELYVGVPAEGTVTLFNQTLLPSRFSWMTELRGKQASLCTASFDPSSGTLGPNAHLQIKVFFTPHSDLDFTDVAALCEIRGMDSPLVVAIATSTPKTLSVSYSLPSSGSPQDNQDRAALLLDFGAVVLKKAVTKQLLITNQTAIAATFTIEAEYFNCHAPTSTGQPEKRSKYVKNSLHSFQAKKVEKKTYQEFVSGLLAHGRGAAFCVSPHVGTLGAFETQTVDVTVHTDMWGEYQDDLICKVGDLEAVLVPMQMTVKGCPLYFQMKGPQIDNQHQGPIIQFGTHISGDDTVYHSLRINNPTMCDICMDWQTYNIEQNVPALVDAVMTDGDDLPPDDGDVEGVQGDDLPPDDGDVEGVQGDELRLSGENVPTTCDETHDAATEGSITALQSKPDMEEGGELKSEENPDVEEEPCPSTPSPPNESPISPVDVRVQLGDLSDYPYCITPQQLVIPAKSSAVVHISFTPPILSESDGESTFVGLAMGHFSLELEIAACVPGKVKRSQGLDLEPLWMDLQAVVKPTALLVQMEEDDGVLEFHATAGDLLSLRSDKELAVRQFDTTRSFQLKNTSEAALHFRLETEAPFAVLKMKPRPRTATSSRPSTADKQLLVLQPHHNMEVKVVFQCCLTLLDHVDQSDEEVLPTVTLVHSASGQRKLKFQQNLLIHYSNNSIQTVPLRAVLDICTLHLSRESLDFKLCYVGHTQIREVHLCCTGSHTYWDLTKSEEGDSDVFGVTPDFGLLRPKELYVTSFSQCLQISFTPCEDREFRALVVVQSPLVKTPLTLQLQGTGSFDEAYRPDFMFS